ncbi:hypothetical protein BGW37DRAFT_492403 [Umbelopsis sp. PMI_123]|nr:hypothetical protein BGW37DRAFT_492403 [Umbelopsis sp. PMI_123]
MQPIVIVECTRFAPAPIVVVRRESTPDGQPPVIIVRGEGLPNKNPVILDRRRNKLKPIIIIDQREDVMFFDGPPDDMMMGNQGAILDEAGNPIMGIPHGLGYGGMNGNGGLSSLPGMPEPVATPGANNSSFPRSSYLRRKPLRVYPAFLDGDNSITIEQQPSESGSTTSSLSDYSGDNLPYQQYQPNLAPIPESYNQMESNMETNGNRRVRFDDAPPRQHVYEREQSDDEGAYDEDYDQYVPAQDGGSSMSQSSWNYPPEQENIMHMPQPMQQRANFDPGWNRPVVWTEEPQQLPNGNWPMPKPRWQLNHAAR